MIESGGPLGLVLPHLELLEGFLHLLAARALRAALGGGAGDRVRPRDAGQPVFRLLIARQDGINEDPGDAAGRDGHEREQGNRLQVHGAAAVSGLVR